MYTNHSAPVKFIVAVYGDNSWNPRPRHTYEKFRPTVVTLRAQLTRDLLAVAKFLVSERDRQTDGQTEQNCYRFR